MFAFSLLDVMMFLDQKPLELAPEMEIWLGKMMRRQDKPRDFGASLFSDKAT
jgi:hypothetical protein